LSDNFCLFSLATATSKVLIQTENKCRGFFLGLIEQGINNFKIGGGENIGFALESNYIKEITNKISQRELNITLI